MLADPWRRWHVVVLFAAALLLIDAVVERHRATWRRYNPDDYRARLDGCRSRQHDLVVVGGSPVSEGFDPDAFLGMRWGGCPVRSAYAMGLPGGTTSEFWHAVEHGAPCPPRVLVYGATASDLNDRRREPHGPWSLMDAADLMAWVSSRPGSAEWVVRHYLQGRLNQLWRLYHHRNGIRLWAADRLESLWPGTVPEAAAEAREALEYSRALCAGSGYAPNAKFVRRSYRAFKEAGGRETTFHFLEHFCVGEHLSYLHRMLDWADAHGTAVVLVDMPVTADLEDTLYPKAYAQFREALACVARTRRVTHLKATRDAVGLTDDDFADLIHLNGVGAAKLSAWVRARLDGGG